MKKRGRGAFLAQRKILCLAAFLAIFTMGTAEATPKAFPQLTRLFKAIGAQPTVLRSAVHPLIFKSNPLLSFQGISRPQPWRLDSRRYLNSKPNFKLVPMREKYKAIDEASVHYFSDEELSKLEAVIKDGKFYHPNGDLIDSSIYNSELAQSEVKPAKYVMTQEGRFYLLPKEFQMPLKCVKHSSLNRGQDVAGAGYMTIVKGELKDLDNMSGHYRPDKVILDQVMAELEKLGIQKNSYCVSFFGVEFLDWTFDADPMRCAILKDR